MNKRRPLWTSIAVIVIAASGLLHTGIARADGRDDADRSTSQREKGARLFVDRDRGRLGGQCTKDDPCARITDALAIARAMRYGTDPTIPRLKPNKHIQIIVEASPMPYLGSPDPMRLAEDPYLEALPLFINISNLDLIGESKFTKDEEGWIEENPLIRDATTIKAEASLPGNVALILIGITEGMKADDVTVQGFVLDGSAALKSGLLIVADRAQRFAVRDTYGLNATYGVGTQGASGIVERCLMTNLGEGVLVFGGNSKNWPSRVMVRDTRSVKNAFGGLAFFGSAFGPSASFPALADFGAYAGVFHPVPFTGVLDRTVGYVIHNDLSRNTTIPTLTSGLRMALIGPNLLPGQSAGHLLMTVQDNHLNENAHGFIIDAGFPFRASSTELNGTFAGRFENNEAMGSLTAKALITFTRNNAAETLPGLMAAWKYLVDSRYRVTYSSGEFDETSGPGGRVWIDNPYVDAGDASRTLNNHLILTPDNLDEGESASR